MSVQLTQTILALHTIWSICVPIAVVETFVPHRRAEPWLGRIGLTVVGVVYALGAGLVFWGNYYEERFLASSGQLSGIGIVIVALVVAAYVIKGRRLPRLPGSAPSPWIVGASALLLTSAWWGPAVLVSAGWYEWIGVAVWVMAVTAGVLLVSRWSRQTGWDDRHRLALAGGAMLTYVWASFPVPPEGGDSASVDLVSNLIFGTVALVILALAARRTLDRTADPTHLGGSDRP